MSAVLYLSGVFAIFAPLPLLLQAVRRKRGLLLLAALTNGMIVYVASGRSSFAIYTVLVMTLAAVMGEMIQKRKSVESIALGTLVSIAVLGIALLALALHRQGLPVRITTVHTVLSDWLDLLVASLSTDAKASLLGSLSLEEWKQSLMVELPSAAGVMVLVMIWANLVAILKINPLGIREWMGLDFFFLRRWKTPEWLVWPTIVSGTILVFGSGVLSDVSLNVFKLLMAVYAIQGMSILSYFFDVWSIRGVFRSLGYLLSIFVMMPLLLGLGFFDLWFDFRAKLRQP